MRSADPDAAREWADELMDGVEACERIVVTFPEPLPDFAQRLMDAFGATVRIDPTAPAFCCGKRSGRRQPTRRELTEETRSRMRDSYFARPDKQAATSH